LAVEWKKVDDLTWIVKLRQGVKYHNGKELTAQDVALNFDWKINSKKYQKEKGWKQYDTSQDAWYFGVWVHPEKRVIITYAEGDITVVRCPTNESYHAELKSMAEFYGPPPRRRARPPSAQ
jgi:ABC-type transport system substrate-binding protein